MGRPVSKSRLCYCYGFGACGAGDVYVRRLYVRCSRVGIGQDFIGQGLLGHRRNGFSCGDSEYAVQLRHSRRGVCLGAGSAFVSRDGSNHFNRPWYGHSVYNSYRDTRPARKTAQTRQVDGYLQEIHRLCPDCRGGVADYDCSSAPANRCIIFCSGSGLLFVDVGRLGRVRLEAA